MGIDIFCHSEKNIQLGYTIPTFKLIAQKVKKNSDVPKSHKSFKNDILKHQ